MQWGLPLEGGPSPRSLRVPTLKQGDSRRPRPGRSDGARGDSAEGGRLPGLGALWVCERPYRGVSRADVGRETRVFAAPLFRVLTWHRYQQFNDSKLDKWQCATNGKTSSESESRSLMSNSLWPHGLYSPGNSPGQHTGVGCLSLLQRIFPTQELNPGLLHCKRILYRLRYEGSPDKTSIY